MTTQPADPTKELIQQTKELVRNAIVGVVSHEEYSRAHAAGRVTDHLIDELAAKLQAAPTETLKIHWPNHAEIKRALQDAVDSALRYIDERGI